MLGQRHHVHVAFDHQYAVALADGFTSLEEAVQFTPLFKQRRFRRIEVLGFALVENAPAKGDHPATHVADGKHHPLAETVVAAAVITTDHQTGLEQAVIQIVGKHALQGGAAGRSPAEAETGGDFAGQATALQVVDGERGTLEFALVETRGLQHDIVQGFCGLASLRFFAGGLLGHLRHGQPHLLRQLADGIDKAVAAVLDQE